MQTLVHTRLGPYNVHDACAQGKTRKKSMMNKITGHVKVIKTQKEIKQHKMFKKQEKKRKKKTKQEAKHQEIFPQAPKQKKADRKNKELRETGNSGRKRFYNNKQCKLK